MNLKIPPNKYNYIETMWNQDIYKLLMIKTQTYKQTYERLNASKMFVCVVSSAAEGEDEIQDDD